jgi:hypothetical protein
MFSRFIVRDIFESSFYPGFVRDQSSEEKNILLNFLLPSCST